MKWKKYNVGILVVLVLIGGGLYLKSQESGEADQKEKNNQIYTTAKELEKQSDIILQGILTERDDIVDRTNEGEAELAKYQGKLKISKVLKNASEQILKEGNAITVNETVKLLPIPDMEDSYYMSGYMQMEEGKEYILFLTYSETEKSYVPMAYGKIPVDPNEKISSFYVEDESTLSKEDKNELDIQKKIAEEVRKKYL